MENRLHEHAEPSRIRLKIEFRVEGDARFLSHHDMMRCMELASARAKLPVRFSQGFNPRPKISLPLPRPVGIAAMGDVVVIELTEPVEPSDLTSRLDAQMPDGVTITECRRLPGRKPIQPVSADYAVPVSDEQGQALAERLAQLADQDCWPCRRIGKKGKGDTDLDLRTLVTDLHFDGRQLRFTLAPDGQKWARMGEVLDLVGLDSPPMRARIVRIAIRFSADAETIATDPA